MFAISCLLVASLFQSCSVTLLSPKNTSVVFCEAFLWVFFCSIVVVLFFLLFLLCAFAAFSRLLLFSQVAMRLTSQDHRTVPYRCHEGGN